jgi:hypothetical protein
MPTRRSPVPSFMPRTPPASRPIGRTLSSRNRTARPLAEVRSTSWPALVIATDTRRSVSSSEIARMPVTRIFSNAVSSVFLTVPLSVARKTKRSSRELLERQHRHDLLAVLQLDHVDERLALGGARALGQLVDLLVVGPALGREQEQVIVGRGGEHVGDEVVVAALGRAGDAAAAAALGLVLLERRALDVAQAGPGDHHVLFGDQRLGQDLALGLGDLGRRSSPNSSLIARSSSTIAAISLLSSARRPSR